MPLEPLRARLAAGIIERYDGHLLIALPPGGDERLRLWEFPRDVVRSDESPEAAMRRVAREQLGVEVEIVVGQPPISVRLEGVEVEMRYFFCGLAEGEARPGPYAEIRWVSKGHLREYDFESGSKPVAEWLLGL